MELRDLIKSAKDLTKEEPYGHEEVQIILERANRYGVWIGSNVDLGVVTYLIYGHVGNALMRYVDGPIKHQNTRGEVTVVFNDPNKAFRALQTALAYIDGEIRNFEIRSFDGT